ncbi:zinc finger matrin-type protein 5 [Venturia canescens]|uniref:zinc finger matrin-type protein 5 n=1 Tax=Venturia canescens TaxID=32260 RepID=UPI001C9C3263|nr:zinc finger matrin-type protein 5-like [Venturia canescens]XP_043279469.1 zinc finger matrin-type protein 5-like [Venturia canescens]
MGKRYYCDYCERSFKDDAEARKKHLSSLQHVKNRADHYNLFKEPAIILREESMKSPCKRFINSGECAFGYGCKFSHYSPAEIWHLRHLVAQKNDEKLHRFSGSRYGPNPKEILDEFFRDPVSSDNTEKLDYPTWSVVPELQNCMNLPPSLWPISPETVTDSDFGKWGF